MTCDVIFDAVRTQPYLNFFPYVVSVSVISSSRGASLPPRTAHARRPYWMTSSSIFRMRSLSILSITGSLNNGIIVHGEQ